MNIEIHVMPEEAFLDYFRTDKFVFNRKRKDFSGKKFCYQVIIESRNSMKFPSSSLPRSLTSRCRWRWKLIFSPEL
jgi:hypothetical protein